MIDGAYDGVKLNCANQAIISDGELGSSTGYSVPLEIKPSGQFEPLYKTTLSVQVCEHLRACKCQLSTVLFLTLFK